MLDQRRRRWADVVQMLNANVLCLLGKQSNHTVYNLQCPYLNYAHSCNYKCYEKERGLHAPLIFYVA